MRRSMPAERRHAAAASTPRLEAQRSAEGNKPACPHAMATGHTLNIDKALAVFQPPMFWLKADAE